MYHKLRRQHIHTPNVLLIVCLAKVLLHTGVSKQELAITEVLTGCLWK